MINRLFVSWQPSCVVIDGVVLAGTRCRFGLLLVFTPCTPLSACIPPLVLFVLLTWPLDQTCILCVPALSPVSVMRAVFVVVLVPACNPVSCCTCSFRPIPALASMLCLTPVGALIPVCSPSLLLFSSACQAEHTPLCVFGVTWRRHVSLFSGDVGDLERQTTPVGLLAIHVRALDVVARTRYESLGGQHLIVAAIPGLSQEKCCETTRAE